MNRSIPIIGSATVVVFALLTGCSEGVRKDFISSAVVESQSFQISTTVQGMITAIYRDEGQRIASGDTVAVIDTVPLMFKRNEVMSGMAQLDGSIGAKKQEIASQEIDIAGIEREYKRTADLVAKGSVPSQQKDNLETQLNSAKIKIQSNRLVLGSLNEQARGLRVQLDEVKDQLRRCFVIAPNNGTILTRFKNKGEVVLPGNPIYESARYDSLQADFYVTQPMLPAFKPGQTVRLRLDDQGGKGGQTFVPATITWISQDAEFSPKNIQTRESRNELVFKIRAVAANNAGLLKRGMPIEVWR